MPILEGSLVRNKVNPASGPGRALDHVNRGPVQVSLLWQNTTCFIDSENLEPYNLFGHAPVQFLNDDSLEGIKGYVVRKVNSDGGTVSSYEITFQNDDEWTNLVVDESRITPLPPITNDPVEHFQTLAWQRPKSFFRRWKMLLIESKWFEDSGGIPAFLGSRIHPMGHQFYAARRVLWDREPRFILADEVGLGKTIEAALVIQALKASNPDLRVLVIAPGSMSRQWQTELYLRFGGQAYKHVDTTSLKNISIQSQDDFFGTNNLIVTTTALQRFTEFQRVLLRKPWDIVIIDEAHQSPPGSPLYSLFHKLARSSNGILVLSATPSKREITSLAGLLSLVSPNVYDPDNHSFLTDRIELQREIWDRLSFTKKFLETTHNEGTVLNTDDIDFLAEQWDGLLEGDEMVSSKISDLKGGNINAANELVAYVQEFHRIDHRIIRTRRSTIENSQQNWSERILNLLEYDPDDHEAVISNHFDELPADKNLSSLQLALRGLYYRALTSTPSRLLSFLERRESALDGIENQFPTVDALGLLTADPGPADEELLIDQIITSAPELLGEQEWISTGIGLVEDWIDACPLSSRIRKLCDWLQSHLSASPENQVLLFAQDAEVVQELVSILNKVMPRIPVKSFHYLMSEVDLSKVALQFQQNKECRVLVSDELGGEGRNFQNASALVHFDLPWSVSRIEQRIGRLDRVGRGVNRPIISSVLLSQNSMERAIFQIHNDIFKVLTQSVGGLEYALPKFQRNLNNAICSGADQINELAILLKKEVDTELQNVDEAFNLSLDASKLQLKENHELAELIKGQKSWDREGKILAGWAKGLGITAKKLSNDKWEFKWTDDQLQRPVHTLKKTGFVSGTFDRRRALADDSQQFFSPGHPLVDALFADLHASNEGRATFMSIDIDPTYRGRIFAVILCRCFLDRSHIEDNELFHGLIVRSQRFLWPEVQPALLELTLDQEPSARIVTDARLIAHLRDPYIKKNYQSIWAEEVRKGVDNVKTLWDSVESAIPLAIDSVRASRKVANDKAIDQLREDFQSDISYLKWLKIQRGETREIDKQIEARRLIIESVKNEVIKLEGVAIIVGQ